MVCISGVEVGKHPHSPGCRPYLSRAKRLGTVALVVEISAKSQKFPKLMAYLKDPLSRRVRTNNHVERTNRMFRLLEKVRYKWRRRRTLVRFVVLTLDGIWRDWTPAETTRTDPPTTARCGKMQSHDRQQSSRVA